MPCKFRLSIKSKETGLMAGFFVGQYQELKLDDIV